MFAIPAVKNDVRLEAHSSALFHQIDDGSQSRATGHRDDRWNREVAGGEATSDGKFNFADLLVMQGMI